MYRTRAIITRGLYTFYPIFEDHFFVFKEVFSENSDLNNGLYSRAVCNQERVMMARERYITFLSHDVRIFPIEYCIVLCICQPIEWKITKSDRKGTGMFFLNLSWANTLVWTLKKKQFKTRVIFFTNLT